MEIKIQNRRRLSTFFRIQKDLDIFPTLHSTESLIHYINLMKRSIEPILMKVIVKYIVPVAMKYGFESSMIMS